MHVWKRTALLAQLWSSPFNPHRGHSFVNTGGCLGIFIPVNLGELDRSVIILLSFWSCFGSPYYPSGCREMNGLQESDPHTPLSFATNCHTKTATCHGLAPIHQSVPLSVSSAPAFHTSGMSWESFPTSLAIDYVLPLAGIWVKTTAWSETPCVCPPWNKRKRK